MSEVSLFHPESSVSGCVGSRWGRRLAEKYFLVPLRVCVCVHACVCVRECAHVGDAVLKPYFASLLADI